MCLLKVGVHTAQPLSFPSVAYIARSIHNGYPLGTMREECRPGIVSSKTMNLVSSTASACPMIGPTSGRVALTRRKSATRHHVKYLDGFRISENKSYASKRAEAANFDEAEIEGHLHARV